MEELEAKLRGEVRRLVGMCYGCNGEGWGVGDEGVEVLGRAVGEVIRLGEERRLCWKGVVRWTG